MDKIIFTLEITELMAIAIGSSLVVLFILVLVLLYGRYRTCRLRVLERLRDDSGNVYKLIQVYKSPLDNFYVLFESNGKTRMLTEREFCELRG